MDFEYDISNMRDELISLCYTAYNKANISIPKLSEWSGIPEKDIEDYIHQDIQLLWDSYSEYRN